MLAHSPAPGLLGQAHLDPRRWGLLALAASRDADDRAHADAWRRRRLRQRWRRQRREEEARERYREGLIGTFAAGDAEGLLPGAARGSSAGGGFDLGNIGRGIGERAGDLGGGLLGVNNVLADELRRHLPPLGWFDADRGAYVRGRLPPERDAMKAAARRLEDLDLGYAPGTTWEAVKRSPAGKAIAFAVEQGLVSVPDMALALASLPAYVLARTGELAGARAEADLRKEATVGDLVAALPGAAASALLERLGARRILGIGDALGSRSPRGVAGAAGRGSAIEGGTETGQEGIEHLTSRLGTATGTDAREMADAMMAGGAAGAIFGGGVRGATATGQALLGRRETPQDPQTDAVAPPPPRATETDAGEAPDVPGAAADIRPAIRLTGEELVSFDSSFQDLRDAALDWYNENLVDTGVTVTNEHDGRVIRFERAGAQKTKSAGEDILRLVPAVPEMLRTGRLIDTRADRKGRRETLAWHRYAALAEVGGRRRNVTLTVRERPDGTFHYSLHRKAPGVGPRDREEIQLKPDSPTPL